MTPAQPPLPTAWYLPFHPSDGIHTSILMSESDDGASVAAMRQCAGSISGGAAGAPPRPAGAPAGAGGPPARPGCTNGPAATTSAIVIVVLDSFSDFRSAHGVAASAGVVAATTARTTSEPRWRVLISVDLDACVLSQLSGLLRGVKVLSKRSGLVNIIWFGARGAASGIHSNIQSAPDIMPGRS